MMLSLFSASLLLAAGSNASPCKLHSGNWTSSSAAGPKSAAVIQNQKLGTQANAGLNLPLQYSQGSSSTSSPGSSGSSGGSGGSTSGGSGTSDTSASLSPASGSCPQGFLNTVFNTNAGQGSGFPSTAWTTLTGHGMNNWSTLIFAAPENLFHLY